MKILNRRDISPFSFIIKLNGGDFLIKNINSIYLDILFSTKNIKRITSKLEKIDNNTISSGVGGSKVVSAFISQVLAKKNNIICNYYEPRDVLYLNYKTYKNIIISSYSGSNYGVECLMKLDLNKYLLSTNKINSINNLTYKLNAKRSFISLNTTIVPMAIMLKYYLGSNFNKIIKDIFNNVDKKVNISIENTVNIFSGIDTISPELFLETTLVEAGIAIPVIHHKYDYCHGRSNINKTNNIPIIYLLNHETDLDKKLIKILQAQNKKLIILKGIYEDEIVNNFYLTLLSIYLMQNIAINKNINLSRIDYDKYVIPKIYRFKGSM